jgi:hypothetical protein
MEDRTLEEVTFDYEKNGMLVRKQISKVVLSQSGTWAMIGAIHKDLSYKDNEYKDSKATIARFKKVNGAWKKQSGFNINNREQAEMIIEFLRKSFNV